MRLDRTKHNKFVTGAVYGNTTSGGITPSSSTATAVGGGGSTVIIQGGGGLTEVSMGMLTNVGAWADETAAEDRFLVQVKDSNQWIAKPISDITSSGGSVSDEDLAKYAKIDYVKQELAKKVDNDFFSRLFELIDENGNPIDVNDTTTAAESIKSKLGLWTEQYLSALGMNPANGEISLTLASLNDVQFANLIEGQSVVWDGSKWINRLIESGGIDESALKDYLEQNQYTTIEDIDAVVTTLENSINGVDADLQEFKQTTADNLALKLDTAFFKSVFGLITDDGEIEPNSEIPTEATIKAKFGLWTEQFLSAKGMNPTDGSVSGIELKDLAGVKINSPQDGEGLVYQNGYWVNQVVQTGEEGNPFYVWQGESATAPTLSNKPAVDWTTAALKNEHVDDYYVTTEGLVYQFTLDNSVYSWALVSDKYLVDCWNKLEQFDGDLTKLSGKIDLKFDADNFTKANIKSTLGISDWALASSKPSYTTKDVSEDTNLYFTNARAVAALKSITDGLGGDISTLQGYFTDGVANSALRLSDNGSYTAWGQTFFTNGKPKSVSGALTDVTDITSSGTITTNKIVIGNGSIEWDEANKGFKVTGLYSTTYLSAMGANSSGGSSSGGGLIESLWKIGDLGKTFNTNANDTFNAYAINAIHNRVSVLEGKATNVSFTQSLTSGTQIGSITIDGVSKNIYAPTIPTTDINKGVTAYGWGDHSKAGYLTSASSLAWGKITGTPTTISGYGITDALTALTSSSDTNLSITVGGTTKNVANLYARYTERFRVVWNNPSEGTYDLNDLLGGYVRAYGSGGTLVNAPESFGHGAVLSLTNGTKALSGQLAWNIKHGNTTDVTKNLYWRVGDSANGYTYAKWHQIAFTDYVDTKLGDYLPLSGGTITISTYIGMTLKHSAASAYPLLWFANGGGNLGAIGVDTNKNIVFDNGTSAYNLIHSNNYTDYTYSKSTIDTKLGVYLPLSGNTTATAISGDVYFGYQKSVAFLASNGTLQGAYGMNDSFNPIWCSGSGTHSIIHSGNIGSQSVNYATSAGNADVIASTYANQSINMGAESRVRLISITSYNAVDLGAPKQYVSGLSVMSNYVGWQLVSGASQWNNDDFYIRKIADNGAYLNWRQIAFTDSNVASATKLNTARTIWGQSFDGTGDVTGDISLGSGVIRSNYGHTMLSSNGYVLIGYETAANGYRTYIDGNDIYLRYGQSHTNGLILSNGGNVLIGTTTDSGYKLHINGTLHASGAVTIGSTLKSKGYHYILDTAETNRMCMAWSNSVACLYSIKDDGSGYNNLRIGGTSASSTRQLFLDYANGYWGVGTSTPAYRWDVNGVIHSNEGIFSDSYISAKGQNTSSDMRLKNVLNEVVLVVKDIANAPSIRFEWKYGGGIDVGSSAQYWQGLLPDAVKERDGMLEMQYANIALLSAIAIAKSVETHEERIARLESTIKNLQHTICILRNNVND